MLINRSLHCLLTTLSVGVCLQSESLSSERKYLLNRVSQLSSELEDAHRTMAALENINVSIVPSSGIFDIQSITHSKHSNGFVF